ncbi:MAG TPA: flagellar basal-body rod protein FlgG [Candidatus Hydrogenedentes bacterium]|nr:flagellar basal-body rod protein FlgG [Candidatus Hydrogenedentota bacterium]HOS03043.1 flagellar basal-body rod protein FlgG [Candidatus Hydrogenedentota bacterium]
MIRALFTAATGMIAQQLNIDTIAHNMANVNTTGFKKSRVNFQDLIYETIKPAGSETAAGQTIPEGIQVGHGVRPASIAKLFSPGNYIQTGNPLDLVIEGDGFFQVTLPDGTIGYTRDGNFKLDANGQIVSTDGYPLQPGITVPNNALSVNIGSDGTVSAMVQGNAAPQNLGTIQLVRFVNPAGLDARLGRNILLETQASGAPIAGQPGLDGLGTLENGFLENSNVQVVEEILNLIIAQRAYEASSKVIQTSDEMLQTANNVRR